tara:strand:- start:609 stop:860 length:252 start_codon:yes stop_codon:yes gene_type:complete
MKGGNMQEHIISYYSKSDGKRIIRPYNPHHEMQYEFVAKGSGKLCKRYWDNSKDGLGRRIVPGQFRLKKKINDTLQKRILFKK